MGNSGDRQWGENLAASGEIFVAIDTKAKPSCLFCLSLSDEVLKSTLLIYLALEGSVNLRNKVLCTHCPSMG